MSLRLVYILTQIATKQTPKFYDTKEHQNCTTK